MTKPVKRGIRLGICRKGCMEDCSALLMQITHITSTQWKSRVNLNDPIVFGLLLDAWLVAHMLQDDKMEPNVLSLFLCFFIQACSATSSFFVELQLSLSSYFFEKLNSINRSRDHGFIVCHYCQTTFFALPVLFNMSANLGLPHSLFRSSIFLKAIVFAVLGVTFSEHWQTPAEHHTSDWGL